MLGYTRDGKPTSNSRKDVGDATGGWENELGLCQTCFGPLYANTYDPEGKQLRRRAERRYLSQFLTGCGKIWCRNQECKTGRANLGLEAVGGSKEAGARIRGLLTEMGREGVSFCVDEGSQRRRVLGDMVAAERGVGDGVVVGSAGGSEVGEWVRGGGYDVEWCVNALEVEGGDLLKARGWLKDWAPTREESER